MLTLEGSTAPFVVILDKVLILGNLFVDFFNRFDLDLKCRAQFVDEKKQVHTLSDDLNFVFLLLGLFDALDDDLVEIRSLKKIC